MIIEPMHPGSVLAAQVLREYFGEIVSRYQGRPATTAEVDGVLSEEPSLDLTPPSGAFLLARTADTAVGCAGLRLVGEGVAEVKRVFVTPAARGQRLGTALMLELEAVARGLGVSTLRLDTRHDLVEARGLYAALGYVEVPAFNENPYAEHWFAKPLSSAASRQQGPLFPPPLLSSAHPVFSPQPGTERAYFPLDAGPGEECGSGEEGAAGCSPR